MDDSVPNVAAYVNCLELPKAPATRRTRSITTDTKPDVFQTTKEQAMMVGADIVSFVAGTHGNLRKAIVNCSLLAQLAANHRVRSQGDIGAWYEAYFEVLDHLGWVIQERGFSEHREGGDDFEANQAILSVASVVLGPASTAFAVVMTTLTAMKAMSDGPWMTVFRQQSQAAQAARFQVTVVEPASDDGVMLSLMAFELNAKTTLTQILFFKLRSSDITLRHSSGKVTIDVNVLSAAGPTIANRVANYIQSYVEDIPI